MVVLIVLVNLSYYLIEWLKSSKGKSQFECTPSTPSLRISPRAFLQLMRYFSRVKVCSAISHLRSLNFLTSLNLSDSFNHLLSHDFSTLNHLHTSDMRIHNSLHHRNIVRAWTLSQTAWLLQGLLKYLAILKTEAIYSGNGSWRMAP